MNGTPLHLYQDITDARFPIQSASGSLIRLRLLCRAIYLQLVDPGILCKPENSFTFQDTSTTFFGEFQYLLWDFGDGHYLFSGDTSVTGELKANHNPGDQLEFNDLDSLHTSGTYGNPTHIYRDTGT